MTFKNVAPLFIFLGLLCFARPAISAGQNFSGSDNFNSPTESSNWGTDSTYGSGALTQTNGYLQFTSAGTGINGDYAARPWVANYGSDTANWSVQIDTTVLQSTADNQFVSFGLEIWDAADTSLYVGDIDGGVSGGYSAYVGTGEDNLLDSASAAGLSNGAVMLSFNAATQVITTYYDSTSPSVGYNWVEIGSFGIAGSGGTTGNVNWDLGPTGTFQVAAVGYGDAVAATAGNVSGDNFLAVPEPGTSALAAAGIAMLFCLPRNRRGDTNPASPACPPDPSTNQRRLSLTAILFLLALIRPAAAAGTDLDQEYAQVRKIALKDPKVQEAFRKANERLNERILEIDPSLKQVVQQHESAPAATTQGAALETRPASAATPEGRHHIVVKGETLSSIATHYKVKVSTLETVNHITNDRKLQVGQNLLIPSGEAVQPQPSPATEDPQPKNDGSLWDRLKSGL